MEKRLNSLANNNKCADMYIIVFITLPDCHFVLRIEGVL